MENKTGFDLNAAIEAWREELPAQTQLTADDRRELEGHLRDTIEELRGRGLNEQEAFLLARRRTGPPQQIAREFVKADPARVWRERVFWMTLAMFAFYVWGQLYQCFVEFVISISGLAMRNPSPAWPLAATLARLFFHYAPLLCGAVLLARGRMTQKMSWMNAIFNSRIRFIVTAETTACAATLLVQMALWGVEHSYNPGMKHNVAAELWLLPLVFYPPLIGLIAWLMPARPRETPKPA